MHSCRFTEIMSLALAPVHSTSSITGSTAFHSSTLPRHDRSNHAWLPFGSIDQAPGAILLCLTLTQRYGVVIGGELSGAMTRAGAGQWAVKAAWVAWAGYQGTVECVG